MTNTYVLSCGNLYDKEKIIGEVQFEVDAYQLEEYIKDFLPQYKNLEDFKENYIPEIDGVKIFNELAGVRALGNLFYI